MDWAGKVIHWELCKRFKFDKMGNGWIHKPESDQETETDKIIWDTEIQTDHPILGRRSDQELINKKKKKKKRSVI